jgi:hypothetical protein
VPRDPVNMSDPAKRECVVHGGLDVDDGQLASAAHGEQVDLATWIAWNARVDRSQTLLERPGELH